MSRPSASAVLSAIGEGRTTAQIAQELQCSPTAAGSRLDALREAGMVERTQDERKRLIWRRV